MDLTESIAPRSDQINSDDLMTGPVTVTITDVHPGAAEQPVDFIVAEYPGRAYRPSKSMRRVIVAAWGPSSATYIGRSLTLYRDPTVTFGRDTVGGIKIAALSHIDKPLKLALTVTRGKRAMCTVQPLAQAPAVDWAGRVQAAETEAQLRQVWQDANHAGVITPDLNNIITARRNSILNAQDGIESDAGDES